MNLALREQSNGDIGIEAVGLNTISAETLDFGTDSQINDPKGWLSQDDSEDPTPGFSFLTSRPIEASIDVASSSPLNGDDSATQIDQTPV